MNAGCEGAGPALHAGQLRILHCLRAPVGGLFRHVCDLTAELAQRGHAVAAVCDSRGDPLTARHLERLERNLVLGLFRLPMSRQIGVADLAAYRAIRQLVDKLQIDVIHGHGTKGGAYARLVALQADRCSHRLPLHTARRQPALSSQERSRPSLHGARARPGTGLPILATAVGGIPEIMAATDTRLIAPEDVTGLAQAMLDVLVDPEAARARAARLRESVARRLTVCGMTEGILDLYASFAAKA